MRLYIVRHADPDYPNNTITPAGHREAGALGRRFGKLGLDRIFVSPLGRARDTARYTEAALGVSATVLDWTQEMNLGQIEQDVLGQSVIWDVHGHAVHQAPESRRMNRGNWRAQPPFDSERIGAEIEKLAAHSDAFLKGLGFERDGGTYKVLRADNREKVAVFCHGGFGLTWLAHLLNIAPPLIWTGFFLPPSSVTTILFDERVPGIATPRALGVGDLSHLYAEDLPMQPAGIKANAE